MERIAWEALIDMVSQSKNKSLQWNLNPFCSELSQWAAKIDIGKVKIEIFIEDMLVDYTRYLAIFYGKVCTYAPYFMTRKVDCIVDIFTHFTILALFDTVFSPIVNTPYLMDKVDFTKLLSLDIR